MNYLIFDIGGTNTKIGFFKDKSFVLEQSFRTIKDNKILDWLVLKTEEIKDKYKIKKFEGIAVSAPGFLESEKLKLTAPTNLPRIRNLRLDRLKKYCNRLVLENDANCAALGAFNLETKINKIVKNLVCFTLGTGFGCGLIINRELYNGNGNASEFGHIVVNADKGICNSDDLENYVSTRGLLEIIRKKGLNVNVFELQELAKKGNKNALAVYKEFGKYLAIGLINITNTLEPDVIYISGGLSNASKFFLKTAINNAKKGFFRGMNPKIRVYSKNLSIIGGLELLRH